MAKTIDKITGFFSLLASSAKSIGKMALLSRRPTISCRESIDRPLIIMGNGPSLAEVIKSEAILKNDTMAVNFAANAPEYTSLAPDFYLLADPHFEAGLSSDDPNVEKLFRRIETLTGWPMTLFIPVRWDASKLGLTNKLVKIERFNPVGISGFRILLRAAFSAGLAMPSPRNVLIPAIMTGLRLGYKEIFLAGADHSWLRTLSVSDNNEVVTIQPHFYEDNDKEKERVTSVYRDVRLHDILLSFHLAFKSYHDIADFARSTGAEIYNSTPGSFIDAFKRKPLPIQ